MKQMRLEIDDDLHDLLMKEQKKRKEQGLPKLSFKTLVKLLLVEGMMQRHMAEKVKETPRGQL